MIRNLKVLGVALAAVFAFSAMLASAASAQTLGKLTSDGPVTLTGTQVEPEETSNSFTAFGVTIVCPGSTYTGHKIEETPHKFIPSGATEVTVTPKYVNCKTTGGKAITIDMNGCDYEFTDFTTTGGVENTYGFTVDIVCGAEPIKITGGACTVEVPGQEDITGFHATNVHTPEKKPGDITLTGESKNVTARTCLGLHTATAVQRINATVKGHNELKEETEITISDQ